MQADKLREIVAFLCGERTLDDYWFGDGRPMGRPQFWWRSQLRKEVDELLAIAEAAEDLRADWIQVPRQEFRAMLHYTECYADKFPSSGARETVAGYFETLQRDAALSTVAPVREG